MQFTRQDPGSERDGDSPTGTQQAGPKPSPAGLELAEGPPNDSVLGGSQCPGKGDLPGLAKGRGPGTDVRWCLSQPLHSGPPHRWGKTFGASHHPPSQAKRLSPSWLCAPDVRKTPIYWGHFRKGRKREEMAKPGVPKKKCPRETSPVTPRKAGGGTHARPQTAASDSGVTSDSLQESRSRARGWSCPSSPSL